MLISTIEDTLKTSALHKPELNSKYQSLLQNRFYGMNKLYKMIREELSIEHFLYIKGDNTFQNYSKFLNLGNFPQGPLLELDRLKQEIKRLRPQRLIVITNNSGDRLVHQLLELEPSLELYLFTRIVSPLKKIKATSPFVTPVEVSLELQRLQLLDPVASFRFMREVSELILTEEREPSPLNPQVFPIWMDCKNFRWNNQWEPKEISLPLIYDIKARLTTRCQRVSDLF